MKGWFPSWDKLWRGVKSSSKVQIMITYIHFWDTCRFMASYRCKKSFEKASNDVFGGRVFKSLKMINTPRNEQKRSTKVLSRLSKSDTFGKIRAKFFFGKGSEVDNPTQPNFFQDKLGPTHDGVLMLYFWHKSLGTKWGNSTLRIVPFS